MKSKNTALFLLTAVMLLFLCACGGDKANESDQPNTTTTTSAQETLEPEEPPISDENEPDSTEDSSANSSSQEEQEMSAERVDLEVLSETRDWIMGLTEEALANLKYDDVVTFIGCEPSTFQVSGEDAQIYQWKADGAEADCLKVSFKLIDGNWIYVDSMLYV